MTAISTTSRSAIQLRGYQLVGKDMLRERFRAGDHFVVFCLATGGGKTVVFSDLVASTLQRDLKARVLILTDRTELLTQAGGTLAKFGIRWEAITADSRNINHRARCFVAMVETFYNRAKKMPWLWEATLVIVDEAHKGNFKKLLQHWRGMEKPPRVVGFTATPISSSKKDPLSGYYQSIVCPVQISQLIAEGFLVPAVTYAAKTDLSALKKDKFGEYSEESQMAALGGRQVRAGLVDKYLALMPGTKAVCFCVNVKHSLETMAEFASRGMKAAHVDGTTHPELRDKIFADFKAGKIQILCNCGIATTGWDEPSVETVIVNRKTISVALWLQMTGRGSRLHPGKTHFNILDMGDNWRELGLWESERDWEAIFHQKPASRSAGVAPVKDCPNPECGAIVHASAKVCPHCQTPFPEKEKEAPEDAEFVQIATSDELLAMDQKRQYKKMSTVELERVRELTDRKPGWTIWKLRELADDEDDFRERLKVIAKQRRYHPKWVEHVAYKPEEMTA